MRSALSRILPLVAATLAPTVACSTEPPAEATPPATSTPAGAEGDASAANPAPPEASDGGPGARTPWSTASRKGEATYYDADGSGNCSFDPSPADLDVVALSLSTDYAASAMCGGCIEVKGAKGAAVVRVVDSCPGCDADHLDLSREAFAKIDALPKGRVPIDWRFVPCNTTGSMSFRFKEGSSKFWTAIQVRNHRVPVAKLEFQKAGAFVEMKRQSYNYFVATGGVGDQPSGLVVRVTSVDGQVVTDTLVPGVADGKTITGQVQFQ